MNRILAHLIAFLLLLTVSLSCKEQVELPVEPAPNLATCRIVKEVYWSGWHPEANVQKVTVKAGGKSYDVMLARETTYSYDEQGRIVEESHKVFPNQWPYIDYVVRYKYALEAIYLRRTSAKWDEQETILINAQGLRSREGRRYFQYDSAGFLLKSVDSLGATFTQNIFDTNMNQVKFQELYPSEKRTHSFTYDLARRNLPDKFPFYGRKSPNLPLSEVYQVDQSSFFPIGIIFQINSYYSFDKHGRVSRQIDLEDHKVAAQQWGQYRHQGGIGVTDYTYECP